MNKRTRVFVLVASSVLIVGLGTAGVASYVGLDQIGLLAPDSLDELSYLPADTQVLAFVDVRHVMDSELRHKLHPNLASTLESSKLIEETGIDIETDVDSVIVTSFDAAGDATGPPLVLARGRFNTSQIEASFRRRDGSATDYKGVRLVTAADDAIAVAFVASDLVVLGTPAAVRLALDTESSGASNITDNADVMRLVRRVEDTHAWTVARFDALQARAPLPPALASQLPSITWFAAGGQVDSGLSAMVHAETRDAKAAQDLREVIRGFVALVRMQAGQQPDFAALVNSVELSGEGTTVSLGFSIPAQIFDKLGALGGQPRVPAAGQLLRPLRPSPARATGSPSI